MMDDASPAADAIATGARAPFFADGDWQRLPRRAHALLVASTGLGFGLSALIVGGVLGAMLWRAHFMVGCVALGLTGAAIGAWLGHRRYRFTFWRLDADGFGVRRGRLFQWETRVPGSRVQHLDIRRGPLERHFGLATLVVHTAGTRHSAVAIAGLETRDAEWLRDALARRTDDDDDRDGSIGGDKHASSNSDGGPTHGA